jgi:probable O-glycosylation ligase (exosortase A-associated)
LLGLAFTLLLTGAGAVLGIARPYYGFLVYVTISILRPESLWHWSVPAGNYSRIVAICLLLGWALSGCGNWNLGNALRPILCLIAFWCWAAISGLFCDDHTVALKFLEAMAKIVLPAVAGLTLIQSRRDLYLLAWTITGSMGYVAYDLNSSYFSGFNRLQEIGFGGMDNNSMTIGLVTGVGFAFFLGLSEKTWWKRYLAFFVAALMTHAVLFSFSRGGMLGLCVIAFASLVFIPKSMNNMSLAALGLIVALAMAGPEVVARFSTIKNNSLVQGNKEEVEGSAESRVELWRICIKMAIESPILGKGPDHYPLLVQNYDTSAGYQKSRFDKGKEAHSLWFQILAELGVPGVGFLAAFYLLTIKSLWKISKLDRLDSELFSAGGAARAVLVSLIGFMVSAQFVSLEGLEIPYFVTIVGLGNVKCFETIESRLS